MQTVERLLKVAPLAVFATFVTATVDDTHVALQQVIGGAGKLTFPLLPHHHVVSRHLEETGSAPTVDRHPLRRTKQQQQLGSLYQGYGTHYIDIWVGYPPQRQTAVVDTGSSVTAFPCSTCQNCGHHTDDPFDERASDSFHTTPCSGIEGRPCMFGKCDLQQSERGECWIEHSYAANGEMSSGWKAYEAEDVAYAGGIHDRPLEYVESGDGTNPENASKFSFALTFGCQTEVSGYFQNQLASGVMGLDRRAQSFWGQMRSQQVIHKAMFSLCFVRQPLATRTGTTAGAVTLGGMDERLNLSPMVFAKTVTEGGSASFKVRVRKMYLRESGGTSVMYDGKSKYHYLNLDEEALNLDGQFDIDSGTTDTYFTESISEEFRKTWKEITSLDYTNDPIKLSDDKLRKLPTVILQIFPHEGGVGDEVSFDNPAEISGLAGKIDYGTPNDIMFAIPAVHYMQKNADGTYTARIYLDRDNAAGSILGANAIMGHNVLFDIDSGRVGIAESECDYAGLVAEALGGAPTRSSEATGGSSTMNEPAPATNEICGSFKCRGFMGVTCAIFFLLFFIFTGRYVTKRDEIYESDFEMKSTRSSNRRDGGYSDDEDSNTGSHGSYRDRPLTSYSNDHRRFDSNERGSHHHSSNSSRSSRHRSSGSDGYGRNPSPRISGDRSHQSTKSHQSMSGSIQSHHSSRSQRSHKSTSSVRTSSSHRSSGERSNHSSRSHGSGGSRESNRSNRSSTSHRSNKSDSRRNRYYDDEDEISRPPSIS